LAQDGNFIALGSMLAVAMRKRMGRAALGVLPAFEAVRFQAPHMLLAALHRRLILELGGHAGSHYEGLAQVGRDARPIIGGQMVTKIRFIDEAAHLLRHISQESCNICFQEMAVALRGSHSSRRQEDSAGDSSSSGDSVLIEAGGELHKAPAGAEGKVGAKAEMVDVGIQTEEIAQLQAEIGLQAKVLQAEVGLQTEQTPVQHGGCTTHGGHHCP